MKITWNGFLGVAVKCFPNEACGFLFSKNLYTPEEEWFVFPCKNIAENPEYEWKPNKEEMLKIKKHAMKLGLTKLGNIHTHPCFDSKDIEELFLSSDTDLKFARKFK